MVEGHFLDPKPFVECMQKWRLGAPAGEKVRAEFHWVHAKGWTTVSVGGSTIALSVRIAQGACGYPAPPSLPRGVIPDEATAVRIAEAVFGPIFGRETVSKFLPYHAQLRDGVWTVYGTLKHGWRGGTPEMSIQKSDGRVVDVWHSR